jgi:hypothetical protein
MVIIIHLAKRGNDYKKFFSDEKFVLSLGKNVQN